MLNKNYELANLLRAFANALSDMNEKQFEELLNGNGKFLYSSLESEKQISEEREERKIDPHILNLTEKLNHFNNREEAEIFLLKSNILKNELLEICSTLNVYVSKRDGKEKIIEKIVESTVGARIRSKAIKDTKLKGKVDVTSTISDPGVKDLHSTKE